MAQRVIHYRKVVNDTTGEVVEDYEIELGPDVQPDETSEMALQLIPERHEYLSLLFGLALVMGPMHLSISGQRKSHVDVSGKKD